MAALIAQFAVGLHVDISDIPLLGGLIDLIGRRGRGRVYLGPTAYFGVLTLTISDDLYATACKLVGIYGTR